MILQQILNTASDLGSVHITLVSNQDNGIASYGTGDLIFHSETGGKILNGPKLHFAHMDSAGNSLKMFFSDRRIAVPNGGGRLQPFSANAIEQFGLTVNPVQGSFQQLSISMNLFGHVSKFTMNATGDVYTGSGPSLGHSSAGVWVLAFTGFVPVVK